MCAVSKTRSKEVGLFDRIMKADAAKEPLRLRPGDVMQLANFFVDQEITRQSVFEASSSYGALKRNSRGNHKPAPS